MNEDAAASLASLGSALSSGMVGFSGASIAINIVLAASLQMLWGLLATL